MPLKIVRNDITKIECDAVVNAANSSLLGGGGVDGAIHRAAGPELLAECRTLGGCKVGEAKVTQGYNMPCKYIIHTVGPVWSGGNFGEEELLKTCYRNSLQLAIENKCDSVAFPLISSGVYGYPKPEAFKVAVNMIYEFLEEHEMLVYVVVFDKKGYSIGEKFFVDIEAYIDDNYVDEFMSHESSYSLRLREGWDMPIAASMPMSMPREVTPTEENICCSVCASVSSDLEDVLLDLDESFSEMLLRKIVEKGMTDAQCYKRANIDRKLFSKIRSNSQYKPSKNTALAFAISLELSLAETEDLLKKAGFALSHSSKLDVIIEYFIKNKKYDIFEINEVLFAFDQNLLG